MPRDEKPVDFQAMFREMAKQAAEQGFHGAAAMFADQSTKDITPYLPKKKHIDDPNRCVTPPEGKKFAYCGETVDIKECIDPTEYKGHDICENCHEDYHEFVAMLPCGDDH
jgi:hypothetical protein